MEPNTYIKPSEIHGLGLFASKLIRKGTHIIHGKPNYDFRDEWIKYSKKKQRSYQFEVGLCMINHCDEPNSKRDEFMNQVALQDIPAGTEITENYHDLPREHNVFDNPIYELEKMMYGQILQIKNPLQICKGFSFL